MSVRAPISDFELANPLYKNASVSWYTVAAGVKTSTLATLYSGISGTAQLANPTKLNSQGQFKQPVYIAESVIGVISGISVPSHDTGIVSPYPSFRVTTGADPHLEYSYDSGVSYSDAGSITPSGVADLMSYVPPGTGAIARSVQNSLRERAVSITDYMTAAQQAVAYTRLGTLDFSAPMLAALAESRFVFIPDGLFPMNVSLLTQAGFHIFGNGQKDTLIRSFTNGGVAITMVGDSSNDSKSVIAHLSIDGYYGATPRASNGIQAGDGTAAGRLATGVLYDHVTFDSCNYAFRKNSGNLDHNFEYAYFESNNYDIYCANVASSTYEAGSLLAHRTTFTSTVLASFFMQTDGNTGMVKLDTCGWYGCYGIAAFIEKFNPVGEPGMVFDNCWMEKFSDHPVVSKTITLRDGTTKAVETCDLYMNDASGVTFRSGAPVRVRFGTASTARLLLDDCYLNDEFQLTGDTASTRVPSGASVIAENLKVDGVTGTGGQPDGRFLTKSLREATRKIGGMAYSSHTPLRTNIVHDENSVVRAQLSTNPATNPAVVTGLAGQTVVVVQDGVFGSCLEVARTAAAVTGVNIGTATTLVNNKWYVGSINYKVTVSPTDGSCILGLSNTVGFSTMGLDMSELNVWKTISTIGFLDPATPGSVVWNIFSSDQAVTVRFSAMQLVEFDTMHQACEFFTSKDVLARKRLKQELATTVTGADSAAIALFGVSVYNKEAFGAIQVEYVCAQNGSFANRWEEAGSFVVSFGRVENNTTIAGVTKDAAAQTARLGGAGTLSVTPSASAMTGAATATQTFNLVLTPVSTNADSVTIIATARLIGWMATYPEYVGLYNLDT